MKKIFILLSVMLISTVGHSAEKTAREITDMAGRKVSIPVKINKIFAVNPVGTLLVYTFNPALLAGWNYKIPKKSYTFIPEKYLKLKNYGQIYGKQASASKEEILELNPDIILYMFQYNNNTLKDIEQMQSLLGIPIVVIDPDLKDITEAYTFLGKITGEEKRGAELSDYSSRIIELSAKAAVKKRKHPSFYYGMSGNGLSTASNASVFLEVFRFCGLDHIYRKSNGTEKSRSEINIEELMKLNPDYIILGENDQRDGNSTEWVYQNESWKLLSAVKNKNVYAVPDAPFNWLDKPPSVNRLSGILWLLWIFYPEEMPDVKFLSEVKEFYRIFYKVKVQVIIQNKNIIIKPAGFIK